MDKTSLELDIEEGEAYIEMLREQGMSKDQIEPYEAEIDLMREDLKKLS